MVHAPVVALDEEVISGSRTAECKCFREWVGFFEVQRPFGSRPSVYYKSCIQCLEYGMFSNRLSYYRQGSFESVSVTLTPGCIVSFFGFLRKCQCMYVRRCKWCTVAIDDYLTDLQLYGEIRENGPFMIILHPTNNL